MAVVERKIGIIGGGASGIFAAIRCGELARANKIKVKIQVFEASGKFLKKVKISGGGRCNVTHNLFSVPDFCQNYPRGQKELRSPFNKFQAKDTVEWFEKRGVKIKAEEDGRMFPVTDSSETIIQCFLDEVAKHNIELLPHYSVNEISQTNSGFALSLKDKGSAECDKVLIATGSLPLGYKLAKQIGHQITELAPSLFTFKINDPILKELAGTSFREAKLTLKIPGEKDFKQTGPLLITHWGLSGPALLKLSAWAAREMQACKYQATILVNWLGLKIQDDVLGVLEAIKSNKPKTAVSNSYPEQLTKRFWLRVLEICSIDAQKRWADLSKKELRELSSLLFSSELQITGKSRFKEEFVECGGVDLKEINFKTMESKLVAGLHFSGEVMDIDGITGGFNFQNAWSSAWVAGEGMVLG